MRKLGRAFGWLFLAAGLVAGGIDLWASLRDDTLILIPLGQHWFEIHAGSLNASQAAIERYVWPPLWLDVIQPILEQPAVVVLCLIGLLLILVCRRRSGRWFFKRK